MLKFSILKGQGMLKEIKSIFTPKGEIAGIPFIINYIILRLVGFILNYIGLYITFNQLTDIPAIKFLHFIILFASLALMVVMIFNYKRRLLQITGNLIISIILAILLSAVFDIFILLIYFRPVLMLLETVCIPLILALMPPKNSNKKEYWSTFFTRLKNFLKNPITIFVMVLVIADTGLVKYSIYKNKQISKIVPTLKMEKLAINPLSSYTGKTKQDILNIRKDYVKTSLFNNDNYAPNEEVFGQIADKKPWWGIDYISCTDKNISTNQIANGNSEESRFINNPNVLIGVHMSKSYVKNKSLQNFCNDKALLFIPQNVTYDKSHKLIIVEYKASKSFTTRINKRFIEFLLVGLNARDFGYNWIYLSNSNNLRFLPFSIDKSMVNEKPQKLLDYIHLDNACRVEGGCNNASPYQPELSFSFREIPADMTLSLWKNKPVYKNQPADIYLKMIFK